MSDLDVLRADPAAGASPRAVGPPDGGVPGEGLEANLAGLLEAARRLAHRVAPAVVEHEVAERGFVPVFVDGKAGMSPFRIPKRTLWIRCGTASNCRIPRPSA